MNILTFDIEEWYLEAALHGGRAKKYQEFGAILNQILELLDGRRIKATFFCLGKMASDFSNIIKKIDAHGHEIGCHSNKHSWLTKISRNEILNDTKIAIDALEQCIGKKVLSYRAPAFSIGENNKWAFEMLVECGIKRDASIFPAMRDVGGFSHFGQKVPSIVCYNGVQLKEFPVCTTKIFGKEIAYSGGGYFRFFPLGFIKKEMDRSDYSMAYFHIGDLLPEMRKVMSCKEYEDYFKEPGTPLNRYKRFIKSNVGTKRAGDKLMKLISKVNFANLEQADSKIDWVTVPVVNL